MARLPSAELARSTQLRDRDEPAIDEARWRPRPIAPWRCIDRGQLPQMPAPLERRARTAPLDQRSGSASVGAQRGASDALVGDLDELPDDVGAL